MKTIFLLGLLCSTAHADIVSSDANGQISVTTSKSLNLCVDSAARACGTIKAGVGVSNYVGINSTNPVSALDVGGTVTATAFTGPLSGAITATTLDVSGAASFTGPTVDVTYGITVATITPSGLTTFSIPYTNASKTLVSVATFSMVGGNLGVGTASPATTLDVNGAAQFGSGAEKSTFTTTGYLNFASGGRGIGTDGGSASGAVWVYPTPTSAVRTLTSGIERIITAANGDTGFNDGTPDGQVEIMSNKAPTGFVLAVSSQSDITGGILSVLGNGNVGIGTTAPASKLSIEGTGAATLTTPAYWLSVGGTGAQTYTNGYFYGMGLGFNGTHSPAFVGFNVTSSAGNTKGDMVFATRDATTDIAPTERARLTAAGDFAFGSGATKSTFTAAGMFVPRAATLAQIQAITPAAAELGGYFTCSNCADPYTVCQSTGATIQGFRLGFAGTAECK